MHFYSIPKCSRCVKEKHTYNCWNYKLNYLLFQLTPFLLERLTGKCWMFRGDYLTGSFLKNEQNSFITRGKATEGIYSQWQNLSFQMKVRILENFCLLPWTWKPPNTEINDDSNQCAFKKYTLCDKICLCLEGFLN